MKNLKCYIDVNFTVEEDFERFSDEDKLVFMNNKEQIINLFKQDLINQLDYSPYIKDLDVVVTFEE